MQGLACVLGAWDMEERRREPRMRVLKKGAIELKDGASVLDCVIRNISKLGARVDIASSVGVPEAFVLRIGDDTTRRCRVVWRKPESVGVEFLAD